MDQTNSTQVSIIAPPALTHRVIVCITLLLVSLVGSIGNSLVVLSVVISKKLRTSTNVFVVNLAVADFMTSLFLPFHALSLVIDNDPALPYWLCGTAMAIVYACLGASLYTLACIAINRLLLITQSVHIYKRVFQPKALIVWVSLIWIATLSITVLPIALDIGQLGFDPEYHICGGVYAHPKSATYENIIVIGLYPLPLITIIFSYGWLYVHLRLHGRRMIGRGTSQTSECSSSVTAKSATADKTRIIDQNSIPMSPVSITSPGIPPTRNDSSEALQNSWKTVGGSPNIIQKPLRRQITTTSGNSTPTLGHVRQSVKKKISKRQLQITKNLFYIVCAFLLCLTPYFLVFLLGLKDAAVLYALSAIFFNSCVNPFVYATKHPHFKKVFECILMCKLKEVPERADFLKSLESMAK